jgi:hypothetical protein
MAMIAAKAMIEINDINKGYLVTANIVPYYEMFANHQSG